jgi:DNA-3-methyladenine glycosylase II
MVPSYITHLLKDKKLFCAINQEQPFQLVQQEKIYLSLCRSIISQQLSTKVASVIFRRFLDLYGEQEPEPGQILETSFDTLRAIGLSNAKTHYIQNVARFTIEHGIDAGKFDKMDNEEIISYLTQIKGVGKWTVEMLLMFTLGREDVFAVDDLGLQNAMIGIYNLQHNDKKKLKKRMLHISNKWKPYRTYACLHLWHWQNNNGK